MNTPNLDPINPTPVDEVSGTEPNLSTADTAATSPIPTEASTEESGSPETQDTLTPNAPPPEGDKPDIPESGAPSWKLLALVGILTLLIIALMAAYGGYRSGMNQRNNAQSTQVSQQVKEQFDLGVKDLEADNLDMARQRFEWVIRQYPNYPGITDKLAEVELLQNITASPTPVPTPTVTPTPDLRSVEELYTQAQQAMQGGDWTNAIDTLLKLRKDAPTIHAVEVDGMLFMALRNRGVDKIKGSDLEGGTYDLALAERFGPLDAEATSWRSWAELYVTGASFWDVDWPQAIEYFLQVADMAPNLMDASGWTSETRLTTAYMKYGDLLGASGDWCAAQEQYKLAVDRGSNATFEATATYGADKCSSKEEKKTPHATATSTEAAGATATPTEKSSGGATKTPSPSEPTSTPQPTSAPQPTAEPPTAVPPTAVPPTAVPPTAVPPTSTPKPTVTA
jgi:tetratricopeptide (TPR) repeat protein